MNAIHPVCDSQVPASVKLAVHTRVKDKLR